MDITTVTEWIVLAIALVVGAAAFFAFVGIILYVIVGLFKAIVSDPDEPEPSYVNRSGYAVYRQMHGYGQNYHPTDMGMSVNAKLYNFPNGPNGPNHPPSH
jgi:hypothetical protein